MSYDDEDELDDDGFGTGHEPKFAQEPLWRRAPGRVLKLVLPGHFFFGDDQLTQSARMLLRQLAFGVLIIALGFGAIFLMNRGNWEDVAAGALLAWTVSGMAWAINSYKATKEVVTADLRRYAELDVLHARLNHIAAMVGAPLLNLNENELDAAVHTRLDRLAHLMGLEEFGMYHDHDADFWDNVALGYAPPSGGPRTWTVED